MFGRPGVTIKWAHVCPWLPYGMMNSFVLAMNDFVLLLMHHNRWSCGPGKSYLLVQVHIHSLCSLQMLDMGAYSDHFHNAVTQVC